MPVQLCLQGGAAKIALLTAFVEAVEELHNQGKLRVTNVAGTSAGAIIGTLFTADVPMSTVRNRLGTAPLHKIVPRRSTIRNAVSFVLGKPLWNENALRKLLSELLSESRLLKEFKPPKDLSTFEHIAAHRGIVTQVMATNLTDGMPAIRRGSDPIVSSLLDSAAVPFLFRAVNGPNSTIVDGGLCENLPSDLLSDKDSDGPIVAISFSRKPGSPPTTLLEYCMAVVGAGIDHSTARARQALEERSSRLLLAHEVFLIDSPIESFDFEKAMRVGLGSAYEDVLRAARKWLNEFIDKRQQQIRLHSERAERHQGQVIASERELAFYKHEMPKNLARLYRTRDEPSPLRWSNVRFEVTVSATHQQPDLINHWAQFHTVDQPVWCHRVPVLVAKSPSELKDGWKLFGPDNRLIPYYHMLMDEDGDSKTLELMICFHTPLPANSGPYSFSLYEFVPGFMRSLRDRERDDLWVSFRRCAGGIEKVEVIAYVPKQLSNIELDPMAGAAKAVRIEQDSALFKSRPSTHEPFGYLGTGVTSRKWGMYLNPSN